VISHNYRANIWSPILTRQPSNMASKALESASLAHIAVTAERKQPMEPTDTLIHARWILPIEPDESTVLPHHSLAIRDGRIVGVLPTPQAKVTYQAREEVDLPHHALIPGLVNAHTHSPMSLMRGLADDLPLMRWLTEHIWPAEQRWVSPEFAYDGSRASIAEMLQGGITCMNDMYFFPDATARAAAEIGMRACIGMIMMDFPSAWASGPDEYLSKGLAVREEFKGESLLRTCFAPHAPYTVSDEPLTWLRNQSEVLDIPIHIHLHETAHEVDESINRFGMRPIERLNRLGLLSPRLLAVHMTQLTDDEIELIANQGVHVLHCPESNMKLGSGLCPIAKLDAAGVNIALGTDGAASNNDQDMLGEMRSAALLAKAVAHDPSVIPAARILRMATLGGAISLGVANEIGSLIPGKSADLAAVNLGGLDTQPVYNPISTVVYAAGRHHVSDVWIAGHRQLRSGQLTRLDKNEILAKLDFWAKRISQTTGDLR